MIVLHQVYDSTPPTTIPAPRGTRCQRLRCVSSPQVAKAADEDGDGVVTDAEMKKKYTTTVVIHIHIHIHR
jgi:hypothetical protein